MSPQDHLDDAPEPVDAAVSSNHSRHNRRQLDLGSFILATSAVATSAVALGGMYANQEEIRKIGEGMGKIESKQEVIIHQIDLQGDKINGLVDQIAKSWHAMTSIGKILTRANAITQMSRLYNLLMLNGASLRSYNLGLEMAQLEAKSHTLSPYLIGNKTLLTSAFSAVKEKAAANGLTLVSDSQLSLYAAPTTLVAFNNILHLIIHVPTQSHSFKLKLYELRSSPIQYNGLFLHLEEKKRYLILNEFETLFLTLDQAQFDKCGSVNGHFSCPGIPSIYSKDLDSDCLVNIFRSKVELVKKTCQFTVTPATKEIIQQLSPNLYEIQTYNPINIAQSCKGSLQSKISVVNGSKTLELAKSCKLTTPHYVLFHNAMTVNRSMVSKHATYLLPHQLLEFPPNQPLPGAAELRRVFGEIEKQKPLQKISVHDFNKKIREINEQHFTFLHNYRMEIALASIVTLFLIFFILYFLCRKWFRRAEPSDDPDEEGDGHGRGFFGRLFGGNRRRALTDDERDWRELQELRQRRRAEWVERTQGDGTGHPHTHQGGGKNLYQDPQQMAPLIQRPAPTQVQTQPAPPATAPPAGASTRPPAPMSTPGANVPRQGQPNVVPMR